MTRVQAWLLGMSAGCVAMMAVSWACDVGPGRSWELKLNRTNSLSPGLYLCHRLPEHTSVQRGALVAFVPPEQAMADLRRVTPYLHVNLMLKRVTAVAPDRVCLQGQDVTLNGTVIAQRPLLEVYPLHAEHGCHTLAPDEIFLLADHPKSYDSRYFGTVLRHNLAATCTALWTWEHQL